MKAQTYKLLLIIGIALVLSTLYSKWEQKYSPKPVTNAVTTSKTTSSAPNAGQIPDLSSETTTHTSSPALSKKFDASGKQISVKTDLMSVNINLDGGNIVEPQLLMYPLSLKNKSPVTLLSNQPDHFYVAQSGLIGSGIPKKALHFSAAKTHYTLGNRQQMTVDLLWKGQNGIHIIKQYTFYKDRYLVKVNYHVQNTSSQPWSGRFYGQLLRTAPSKHHSLLMHYSTFTGAATSTTSTHFKKWSFSDLQDQDLLQKTMGGWVSMIQHYFISAWVPAKTQNVEQYSRVYGGGIYGIGLALPSLTVAAHQSMNTGASLYIGPSVSKRLEAISPYLNLTINYGWLYFIAEFLFWMMSHIYQAEGNWGVAIILVTVAIKVVFYPLSAKSFRSMAKMRLLQPKMKQLKERHGDDRQAMGKATMELYKKEKVNPLSSCLPILIQIPFFIALYWMLVASVELRQAPFIFWIKDLSAHDPYFVLPILMGISMFVQQRLNPPPTDPMQAKMMMALPVIFTLLFMGFPAGLVLYWLVNTVIGILQQWYVLRKVEAEEKAKKTNR